MNIAFIYNAEKEYWNDGLRAAIELIDAKDGIDVFWSHFNNPYNDFTKADFVLTWGAFSSPQAKAIAKLDVPKGICVAGGIANHSEIHDYDVLFVETEWQRDQFRAVGVNPKIAFGTNTDLFYDIGLMERPIDRLYPAAFAKWKRHEKFIEKPGFKVAVGYMQPNGQERECYDICMKDENTLTLPRIKPHALAFLYNQAKIVSVTSTTLGGGERTVLEALASGCAVEVEEDNPKLKQLLSEAKYNIPTHKDYAEKLVEGIKSA